MIFQLKTGLKNTLSLSNLANLRHERFSDILRTVPRKHFLAKTTGWDGT